MRTSIILALLLAPACGGNSPAPEKTPPAPTVPDGQLVVKSLPPGSAPGLASSASGAEAFAWEIGTGAEGELHLGLWDRRVEGPDPATDRLWWTKIPVERGERRIVELRYRVIRGREVLRELVAPLGGEAAVSALKSVAPGFESAGIVQGSVHVAEPDSDGGGTWSFRFQGAAVPPETSACMSSKTPIDEDTPTPAGEERLLFYSVWLGDHASVGSPRPPRFDSFSVDGKLRSASEHDLPFWTFRARLVSE